MNASRAWTLMVAILIGVSACAHGRNTPDLAGSRTAEKTSVTVTNNNWSDVVVYAVRSGTRHRLGMVTGLSRATFKIPAWLSGPGASLQLLADPVGSSDRYLTTPIMVLPGQRVDLTLQSNLAISSYSVR